MAEKKKRTGIWGYVDSAVEAYDKYKDIAKAGASAVKGYLDYKNQKKLTKPLNELTTIIPQKR